MFAGKKSAQIREILISESAWEEMTCLFAPSLIIALINYHQSINDVNSVTEFNIQARNFH
ncbi:hypothetical protein GIB25_26230 [Escherichia coli]|nr:hypothetical protein [Escherichia coli]